MDSKAWTRLIALVLILPVAVACSSEEETEANIEVETEPAAPAAPVAVQFVPQGTSMVAGDATATHGADQVAVRVNLSGLTEGQDYEAKLKYGTCAEAQSHFTASRDATETDATPDTNHEPGEEFGEIEIAVTGTTGTGSIDIDNDELGAMEPAYIAIEIDDDLGDDDQFLACADLSGHSMGDMGPAPTPGAEAPVEPAPR